MMINDKFESRMRMIDEIDDKLLRVIMISQLMSKALKLLLCDYCQKEYLLPSYKSCKYFILS